ncbi:hypothetical protein MVEN_00722900 [Mycena venus]|uniref:Uncharacterized protein n=1 Tax=Mycena venus TaxID=2733690 RepID=A0A8H6YL69_9AGAR|nr:hypothetical protein MVEN_00722900 [Mycena venus]
MAPSTKSRGGRASRGGRGGGGRKPAGTKRPAAADTSDCEEPPAPKKARQKKVDPNPAGVEPPLATTERERPSRANAGAHMAELVDFVKPRAKRSHAEVLAAQKQKADAAEQRERERDESIEEIAGLNADQDDLMAEEEANAVNSLDDLPSDSFEGEALAYPYNEDEPILDVTQEGFDRIEEDEGAESGSEYGNAKPKARRAAVPAAVPKRLKKPEKLQTRGEIEAATRALQAAGKKQAPSTAPVGVKKKGVQNSDAAAASNKAGLSRKWKNAVDAQGPAIGGLTDEDAEAARPDFGPAATARAPRKNNASALVILVDNSEDETPTKVPGKSTTVIQKVVRKPRQSVKVEGSAKIPALDLKSRNTPKLKTESSDAFTPESAADIKGLPAFIHRTWSSHFLPEAYRALFSSEEPMQFSLVGTDPEKPGKETVAVLQEILDRLYPQTTWALTWGDVICSRAVSRIGERRSAIARATKEFAENNFKAAKYFRDSDNSPRTDRISRDAKYAVRKDGPAFYKNPTPEDCRLDPKNAAYIKPTGYMESPAIIAAVSQAIAEHSWQLVVCQDANGNDVVDYSNSNLPVGALGMAAASAERAYKMFLTGERIKPRDFSYAYYGTAVAGFIKSIKQFRPSRWESIIQACGASLSDPPAEDGTVDVDESLDGVREYMYIPSSPC